jgi:hypothetical protein
MLGILQDYSSSLIRSRMYFHLLVFMLEQIQKPQMIVKAIAFVTDPFLSWRMMVVTITRIQRFHRTMAAS